MSSVSEAISVWIRRISDRRRSFSCRVASRFATISLTRCFCFLSFSRPFRSLFFILASCSSFCCATFAFTFTNDDKKSCRGCCAPAIIQNARDSFVTGVTRFVPVTHYYIPLLHLEHSGASRNLMQFHAISAQSKQHRMFKPRSTLRVCGDWFLFCRANGNWPKWGQKVVYIQ